ncbi:MAG: hypothetical protein II644_07190, partial [Paludibacteraceae bacterium]|nr:hypothetical protein [Paludibacteraceae bacterium]
MRNYLLNSSEALPKSQGGVFAKKNTIRATLHPTLHTLSRATRYAATLLLLLCLGVGNAWGTDFSATEISTSGTSKGNITCKSVAGSASGNSCTEAGDAYASSVTVSKISNSGIDNYMEIHAASGYKLTSPVVVTGVVDNNADKNIVVVCWEGDYDNSQAFKSYEVKSWPNRKTACASTDVSITFSGTVRTIRLYKQVYVHTTNKVLGSSSTGGYTQLGSGTNLNVTNISATAESTGGGCTSHSVNLSSSGSVTGGTFATSSATVCEEETATLTATPAAGYVFTSWSASGTGSSLSSTTTNPTTLTMGTADVSVNATFTKVYA